MLNSNGFQTYLKNIKFIYSSLLLSNFSGSGISISKMSVVDKRKNNFRKSHLTNSTFDYCKNVMFKVISSMSLTGDYNFTEKLTFTNQITKTSETKREQIINVLKI